MRHDGHTIASDAGTIRIEGHALAAVVVAAAELVDGARVRRPKRGLDIQVEEGRVRVEVELAARYGAVLPELGAAVQRRVAEALRSSSGLVVAAVDVSIEELDP
ncbi:MAG: Asp23/Gls24 family envelope stress response protein [Actinobacteria bacterium]|nr:Asp23/Gls24 family envelope stress response protein [Actinomycetota bacterium]